MQFGETKEVMKYETILTIKETEKATVVLAAVEGIEGPVIVKKLKGANADVYRLLCHAKKSCFPVIYAIEETESELLIAEEHIAGETLGEVFGKRTFTDQEKLELALKLCDAVEFLHHCEPPVIHRDIKPSNILVTKSGEVKLIDFDASRLYKEKRTESDTRLLGTAEYAPPEQFGYAQTDVRSDIYSLGVVLREFTFSGGKIGRKWEKIVQKCTNFAPEHRYQAVNELKKELERLKLGRTHVKYGMMAGGILGGILLIWLLHREGPELSATLTPTPTPIPILTPTPAMAWQEMVTPVPTASVTPAPTVAQVTGDMPTMTPEPTTDVSEVFSEEEMEQYQKDVEKYLQLQNRAVDHFYRGSTDYMLYSSYFEMWEITLVRFVDYVTQERRELKKGDFTFEDSMIGIPAEFMETLGNRYYEVTIIGKMDGKTRELNVACKVHDEERPEQIWHHLAGNELEYEYPKHEVLHVILRNDSNCKITGLNFGEFVEIETDLYQILHDGKAMELSGELLQKYLEWQYVEFYVLLDNGTKERLRIVMP